MKNKIISILSIFLFGFISLNISAQQNYVYDGETFNVWLKTNSSDTQVLEVYFTTEGQWNQFTIVEFQSFDDKNEGFTFKVKDGADRFYWIDYYRNKDYIIVTDAQDEENWTLSRREE